MPVVYNFGRHTCRLRFDDFDDSSYDFSRVAID